ncbi:hypothetical protein JYK14_15430 [Siccirubricoccus sp. KC 17139]|uniref:Uncharacterized protein n=1 Tax=Siccirubricoccus soli TaxID=2899147 RepID=A0ABT1D7G3_9PROT|nr:hypothetical protein [Siccirubricoccus soli]MCO6417542.1 hypothetical protein [Siccirubricoccus soli]MCP2683677.1 hypothetical protein [Siccirubricoccus soli]
MNLPGKRVTALPSFAPLDPPPPGEGRFDLLLLPALRLLLLRYLGEVRLGQVLAGLGEALRSRPEVAGWNTVADLRRFTGHLGVEGINALAALRREACPEPAPSRQVLLSHDPGMGFVATYLNAILPEVHHSVAAEPAAACRGLLPEGMALPEEALAFLGLAPSLNPA